jgi:hypothetical protein
VKFDGRDTVTYGNGRTIKFGQGNITINGSEHSIADFKNALARSHGVLNLGDGTRMKAAFDQNGQFTVTVTDSHGGLRFKLDGDGNLSGRPEHVPPSHTGGARPHGGGGGGHRRADGGGTRPGQAAIPPLDLRGYPDVIFGLEQIIAGKDAAATEFSKVQALHQQFQKWIDAIQQHKGQFTDDDKTKLEGLTAALDGAIKELAKDSTKNKQQLAELNQMKQEFTDALKPAGT